MNKKCNKTGKSKAILLAVFLVISMTGCSLTESLFTDSGTNLVAQTDTSAYLDLSLLEKQESPDSAGSWNGYEVWTLEYGTFSTDIIETKASINMVESVRVKADIPSGSMILTELLVSKYAYVEKGDVLARVNVETSDLDMEELELKLTRLEEEYAQTTADYNERHEDAVANISVYNHPGNIDRIKIAQMELDFEQTRKNYESRIADYKEQIKDMKAMAATKEIVAPQSGFVLSVSRLQVGQELNNGTVICTISPTDKIVLEIKDENLFYGYGMDLIMGVGANSNPNRKEYEVTVGSASGKILKEDWSKATTQITGDFAIEEVMNAGASLMVGGKTNVMENVLLIPAAAVIVENPRYYVTVLHEDGRLEKRQFIPGGNNQNYYWVFEGLEQGTKIIIEN